MDTRINGLNGKPKATRKPAAKKAARKKVSRKKPAADPAEAIRRGVEWLGFVRGVLREIENQAYRVRVAIGDGHPIGDLWDAGSLLDFEDEIGDARCLLANFDVPTPSPVPIPDPIGD